MGRKNKSKQSVPTGAAPPSTPLSPSSDSPDTISPPPPVAQSTPPVAQSTPPVAQPTPLVETEPAQKKRNDSECSNKSKGGKGKNKQGQAPPKQAPKQPSPDKCPIVEEGGAKSGPPVPSPTLSPDSASSNESKKKGGNKVAQTAASGEAKVMWKCESSCVYTKVVSCQTLNTRELTDDLV